MTRTLIENGLVWQEDGFVRDQTLIVVDGVIHSLQAATKVKALPGDRQLDCRGAYVMPGFVDLHVHGSNGFDVMDATDASLVGLAPSSSARA